MADKSTEVSKTESEAATSSGRKPRVRKAPVSFREAANQQQSKDTRRSNKPRRGSRLARIVFLPFRLIGKLLATIFKPFRFILRPFKTKPIRFIGRILATVLLVNYFRNSWKELRNVTWPSRRETWKLTFAVFMFAAVFGTMIALVDYGLDKVFKRLILK